MAEEDPSTLTAEGARYWLRAAEWSPTIAALLLRGVDPREHEKAQAKRGANYHDVLLNGVVRETSRLVLRDVQRVNGRNCDLVWIQWSPQQWISAARKAGQSVPTAGLSHKGLLIY